MATCRDRPKIMPPMMVAPERLVPGISAKACARPSFSASTAVRLSMSVMRGLMFSWRFSTRKMIRPPTTRATATGTGPNR